jgi:hypothetical protein
MVWIDTKAQPRPHTESQLKTQSEKRFAVSSLTPFEVKSSACFALLKEADDLVSGFNRLRRRHYHCRAGAANGNPLDSLDHICPLLLPTHTAVYYDHLRRIDTNA